MFKRRARDLEPDKPAVKPSAETTADRPNYSLVAKVAALGVMVSVFVTLLFLDGPEPRLQAANAPSAAAPADNTETVVARRQPPQAQPPSQPAVQPPAPQEQPPASAEQLQTPAVPVPTLPPLPEGESIAISIPSSPSPVPVQQAPAPSAPAAPVRQAPAPQPPAAPAQPAERTISSSTDPLPWQTDADRPSGTANTRVASIPPQPAPAGRVDLPSGSDIGGWIRSAAREFVGGVDADGLPLYRFDLWLDMPDAVRAQVRSVAYEYLAPGAQPPTQSSSDAKNKFRVKFGAAACAEKAKVTLTMADGQQRQVTVDGCRILN